MNRVSGCRMGRYYCISIVFLDPLFHGRSDDGPEWPPSPMRLLQAIVAGAHHCANGAAWNNRRSEALEWIERRAPPLIIAPQAVVGTPCQYFVPNNDSDKTPNRQERLTGKTFAPHWLRGGDTVHYVWEFDGDDDLAERLRHEARLITALGWGIDQVVGNGRVLNASEVRDLPGQRWWPWDTNRAGDRTWRVPIPGTLADLDHVHQSFTSRVQGKLYVPPQPVSQYGIVHYLRSVQTPPRAYAVFEVPEGATPYGRATNVARVAAMVRHVACEQARRDPGHQFPGGERAYVAGHVEGEAATMDRLAYVPLPTIGHEHADGNIRRVLVAEHIGGDGSHAKWAQRRMTGAKLQDEHGDERGILGPLWRKSSSGNHPSVVARYVRESATWATVTPVILPGYDDGKQSKAERLFLRAAAQAGVPVESIAEIALRKAPFWPGAQHPRQYFLPAYLRRRRSPGWHVWMRLREPLPGPIFIGAGRFIGLGVFAGFSGEHASGGVTHEPPGSLAAVNH
jgi:CRISPR-associated protein Csb2